LKPLTNLVADTILTNDRPEIAPLNFESITASKARPSMASRRTTRATSASDVGGPALSATHSQTRSTTGKATPAKRNSNGPKSTVSTSKPKSKKPKLPKAGLKGNSAYGTNNELNPTQLEALVDEEYQDKIMGDLLNSGQNLPQVAEELERDDESDHSR